MRWTLPPAMLLVAVLAPQLFSEAQPSDKTLAASGRVSTTAEAVCMLRAVAAKHSDPKIRNPDYLAEKFVSAEVWRTSPYRNDPDRARSNPNYFWVNARTHHMDALLVDALSAGVTQVVNLGAGFDSRAYRFRVRFPTVRFFELDLPAMIAAKRERVVRIFGAVPDRVVLVPTDFTARPLDEVLRDAGYERTQRTFFIWEGVTMYLPEAANLNTLRFIRGGSASGSSVVYDYGSRGAGRCLGRRAGGADRALPDRRGRPARRDDGRVPADHARAGAVAAIGRIPDIPGRSICASGEAAMRRRGHQRVAVTSRKVSSTSGSTPPYRRAPGP